MPEVEHPTEELLSALFEDGLAPAEAEHLLAHLDACSICRQRIDLIEPALARYQRCRELIAPHLPQPPEPWQDMASAMDRVERARRTATIARTKRAVVRPAWVGAAAAAILVGAILFWPQSNAELRADTLLLKARSAPSRRSPLAQVRIRTANASFVRPAVLRSATAEESDMESIGLLFAAAGYDWGDPLSAAAYSAWRGRVAHRTQVSESGGQSTIRTVASGGALREVSLTLDAADLSPVTARFLFAPQNWVEIGPAPDAPADAVPVAPAGVAAPEAAPSPTVGRSVAERNVAEREILTWLAIDQLGAGAGEPIGVDVEADGRIVVTPYRLGERRESQLRAGLQGVERVTVISPQPAERQEDPPASTAGADPAIDASNSIASRAHLLSRLAERFPPETEAGLSAASRDRLRGMRARHARALEDEIDTLAKVLAQSRPLRLSPSEIPPDEAVPRALVDSAVAVNRMVTNLYLDKSAGEGAAWQRLGQELSRLKRLASRYAEEVRQ
jgi:hypothetical protein